MQKRRICIASADLSLLRSANKADIKTTIQAMAVIAAAVHATAATAIATAVDLEIGHHME